MEDKRDSALECTNSMKEKLTAIMGELDSKIGVSELLKFGRSQIVTSGSCTVSIYDALTFIRAGNNSSIGCSILRQSVLDICNLKGVDAHSLETRNLKISFTDLTRQYLYNKNSILNMKRDELGLDLVNLELDSVEMSKLCSKVTRELKRSQISSPRLRK